MMGRAEKTADHIAKSLMFAIKAHRHHIGIYPAKIFAELDAYYALQNNGHFCGFPYDDGTFYGIPIVPISKEGLGIYLSYGPVKITAFQDLDVQPIFPGRDNDDH